MDMSNAIWHLFQTKILFGIYESVKSRNRNPIFLLKQLK